QRVLLNKRIIIGICGGIASYKAVDLVSKLQQAGALVDVILTEHAEDFVRPLTFSTMSHRPVYSDLWEASGRAAETHIALAEEAELLVIVPATDWGATAILLIAWPSSQLVERTNRLIRYDLWGIAHQGRWVMH